MIALQPKAEIMPCAPINSIKTASNCNEFICLINYLSLNFVKL